MTNKPTLKSRIASSFAWAVAGTGGQVLFQIGALAVLARLLSPAEFGIVSAATILTQLSLILNEFGIGPAIVQRRELNDHTISVGFTLSCLFGGLVILVLWLSSSLVADMLRIPELTWVVRVYSAVFLLKSYSAIAESLLQRDMEFRFLAKADAMSFAIGYAGVGILAAMNGLSYWSLVLAHVSQAALKASMVLMYRKHPKSFSLQLSAVREYLHFGLGQSISRLGSFVASQGDSFVVAKVLGVEKLGEYGRANQLVVMPANQLGGIFDKVLFPTFAQVQEDKSQFGAAYGRALSVITMLGVPATALLFIVTPEFVLVVLGEQWNNIVEPMKILSLGLLFRLLHKISDPTARAAGAVYQRAWRQILVAGILIAGAYAGANFGLIGVAYGVLFATMIDALLMVQLCIQIAGLKVKRLFLMLFPGLRLGIYMCLLALGTQGLARYFIDSKFYILSSTLTITIIIFGALIYLFPKLSMGRAGIDTVEYVGSLLNIKGRWTSRASTV